MPSLVLAQISLSISGGGVGSFSSKGGPEVGAKERLYKPVLGYRFHLQEALLPQKDFRNYSPSGLSIYPVVQIIMDNTRCNVTLNEFRTFHGIDRSLFVILVSDLGRDPMECLFILGLWFWLERGGFYNFISKILPLPPFLINEFADEAVMCLKCVNHRFPFSSEASTEIPLTHSLAKKDISLQFFYDSRRTAFHEIQSLVNEVCIPLVSDIIDRCSAMPRPMMGRQAYQMRASSSNYVENYLVQSMSSLRIVGNYASTSQGGQGTSWSRDERTMFVTFSKGYPVAENEVMQYFTRLFGNCVESFHMQEVRPDEQALYAKIVFRRSSFIRLILHGVNKAKFTINGKHVWMRKFVPRFNRP
ncbi:hypothetical protein BUALT_Bualt09G0041200 [Buddleja alternifolia]|uniref:RRM domain-containing protein n=1 Tax=Buddleja alternifolia TaxID=168488 RepID=A0AAV6X127_9LAMI|nr:hypothetical protein BUALT_Bualt09G0041200 [Buddleja alternifolia]